MPPTKRQMLDSTPFLQRSPTFLLNQALTKMYAESKRLLTEAGVVLEPRDVWILAVTNDQRHSQTTIAQMLGINPNSMVRFVDRLESEGYLKRVENPENRREYSLLVTPKGESTVQKWFQIIANSRGADPLSESELSRLCSILIKYICQ